MASHKLGLEAPDTLNPCILRVVDISVYNANMNIKCPTLLITPPGFSSPFQVDNIQPEFIKNLTACDLKLQTSGCGTTFNDLSDGVYVLHYSVSPNDTVYVEYNHMRITRALLKLRNALCELDLSGCAPNDETLKKQRKIGDIHTQLLVAKALVENCRQPKKGMEIYKYALQQLDKLECKTCK